MTNKKKAPITVKKTVPKMIWANISNSFSVNFNLQKSPKQFQMVIATQPLMRPGGVTEWGKSPHLIPNPGIIGCVA